MEGRGESSHQKGILYPQEGVFFWCIQGRLKLLDVIAIK